MKPQVSPRERRGAAAATRAPPAAAPAAGGESYQVHVYSVGVGPGVLEVLLEPLPQRVRNLVKADELFDLLHLRVVARRARVEALDDGTHVAEDAGVHECCRAWRCAVTAQREAKAEEREREREKRPLNQGERASNQAAAAELPLMLPDIRVVTVIAPRFTYEPGCRTDSQSDSDSGLSTAPSQNHKSVSTALMSGRQDA